MTSDREGEGLAVRFMEMGYHAAILRYSTVPEAVFPDAFLQAAACMKMLRECADKWFIDSERILIQGSSAGGHLAAMVSTYWHSPELAKILGATPEMIRPNGQILSYPVITAGTFRNESSFKNLLGSQAEEVWRRHVLWNSMYLNIRQRLLSGTPMRIRLFRYRIPFFMSMPL